MSASSLSRWECAERRPPATLVPALSRHLELSRAEAIALFDDYPDSGRDTVGRLRGLGAALDRASVDRGAIAHVCCVSVSRVDAWATGRIAVPASAVQPLSRLLGIDVLHHLADLRHPVPTPPRPLGELRRSCRLTQAGLAAALGVSGSTVGTWERGERVPRPHQVRTLARILRLHPAALVAATGWELPGPVDLDQAGRHGIPGTLVALRLAEGLLLAQVARSVGVTAGTVRRWEKGRTRPSSARITRLAAVYRVDADVLHRLARSTPSRGVITEGNLPWTSR